MTGLHDKRATGEYRRSKRPERSRPEVKVAEPPARRAKHAEDHVPLRNRESARVARPPRPLDSEGVNPVPPPAPPKRERSVPASRISRSSSPLCGDWGSEDVIMHPPHARCTDALAPPPKRERSVPAPRVARSSSLLRADWGWEDFTVPSSPPARRSDALDPPSKREDSPDSPRTAYVLRNRDVLDTGNHKPTPPPCYEKREIKQDQPRFSKKQLKQKELWQAPACARKGLERYNSMNQGDEHELVEAVGVNLFPYCGAWLHASFLARRKGDSNCVDLVPKYFFAELKIDADGLSCVSCFKIDAVDSRNLGGCGVCPATLIHPAAGGYIGAQPERRSQPAESGLQILFSF